MQNYADATRLSLGTGAVVQALVRVGQGAGRPKVVLVHGNPGSLADWDALVPLLSPFADVVAFDLPGFGLSDRGNPAPEGLGLERSAEHAMAVAEALGWHERIHLVGHSHGGGVAAVAAARWPEKLAGVVLLGTLGAPAHGTYRLLSLPGAEGVARTVGAMIRAPYLKSVSRRIVHQVMRGLYSPEHVAPERLERELELFARRPEILVAMVHVALGQPGERVLEAAAHIRCPTLFLHGAKDAIVPARCARAIHERIVSAGGTSEFDLVADAGHLFIDFQAADVAGRIRRSVSQWAAS